MTAILEVEDLRKYFPVSTGLLEKLLGRESSSTVKAVDGVSFTISAGETLGLVGESGCGKSTTGKLILKALEPTDGQIRFEGQDITRIQAEALQRFRQRVQIVFQDPTPPSIPA